MASRQLPRCCSPVISTRTRRQVVDALDQAAKSAGKNRSWMIEELLEEGLRRRGFLPNHRRPRGNKS